MALMLWKEGETGGKWNKICLLFLRKLPKGTRNSNITRGLIRRWIWEAFDCQVGTSSRIFTYWGVIHFPDVCGRTVVGLLSFKDVLW